MKKHVLALLLGATLLMTGCNPTTTEPDIEVSVTGFQQTGTDFSFTLTIDKVKDGKTLQNIYELEDGTDVDIYAQSNWPSLMRDTKEITQTVLKFNCTYQGTNNTATHYDYRCTDDYYTTLTSLYDHRIDLMIKKYSMVTLQFQFEVSGQYSDPVTIGTINTMP